MVQILVWFWTNKLYKSWYNNGSIFDPSVCNVLYNVSFQILTQFVVGNKYISDRCWTKINQKLRYLFERHLDHVLHETLERVYISSQAHVLNECLMASLGKLPYASNNIYIYIYISNLYIHLHIHTYTYMYKYMHTYICI